ncbi:Icc-related predicted phosphoesterase [Enterococcus sp. PF1-24]|uniref:DNA-binding protein n=1 Tax=unclassified Enterococcus TaxID=2608891 RepID=UPI00247699A8|nr:MULTISPECIES: DNA-binding protein [unclassified Enterococcus]MDH6363700.1 Icc-related predicted phosphoesterase [Enterococcus sp. PFB1-1]MDH6400656.1 Icc-related predicted phosphoesterase [Enterococcus sp. PF1-24]
MQLNTPIVLPDDFIDEVADTIVQVIMNRIDKQLLISELPPYPNKKEIMKTFRVGDERINQWMNDGLFSVGAFGNKEVRFDRDDIKKYINSTKY